MKRCERAKADVSIFELFRKTAFSGSHSLLVEVIRLFFDIRAKRLPWDCFLFSMLLDKFSKLHEKNCLGHPAVAEFPQGFQAAEVSLR